MSIGRLGSHECEPVSSQAIPLRYSIGQEHPEIDACPVHEGRVGHQSDVRGSQHAGQFLWALLTSALVLALVTPDAGYAQERHLRRRAYIAGTVASRSHRPAGPRGAKAVSELGDRGRQELYHPSSRAHRVPLLLNQFDRHFVEPKDVYRTGTESFWKNLTDSKWVVDQDPFGTNQFLHPYGGSIYYGLPRSTGLDFLKSFGYATTGSFLWELGGETGAPSINDQITTPIGGSFLGEPLFRMASLLPENDGRCSVLQPMHRTLT